MLFERQTLFKTGYDCTLYGRGGGGGGGDVHQERGGPKEVQSLMQCRHARHQLHETTQNTQTLLKAVQHQGPV